MFRRIVLCADLSQGTERLIPVLQHISADGATVDVVHVREDAAMGVRTAGMEMLNQLEADRQAALAAVASQVEAAGLQANLVTLDGVASEEIVRHAERTRADLLVLGTLGHSRLWHLLLGSTSTAILRHAPCPVLTINVRSPPPSDWTPGRLLFPTDLSPMSQAGVAFTAQVARHLHAGLTLVNVIKTPTFVASVPGASPVSLPAEAFEAATARVRAELEALAEAPDLEGIDVRLEVLVSGDTAEGIDSAASVGGHGLIVIPRYGRGVIRAVLFGRVVTHVIKIASLPVLSFRPGPAKGIPSA